MAKVFNTGGGGSKKDLVTVTGSGVMNVPPELGEGPYTIEFTEEESENIVTEFNGRTGSIIPKIGDYTAEMVGATTMEQVNLAIQTSIQSAIQNTWEASY